MAHVALTPCLDPAGDGMHVLITAAVHGGVFGLAHSQAGRPPNVEKEAAYLSGVQSQDRDQGGRPVMPSPPRGRCRAALAGVGGGR